MFPAAGLVGLGGREPVAEGDGKSVERGLPSHRPPGLAPMALSYVGMGISQKTVLVSGASRVAPPGLRVLYRPPGRLVLRS